LGFKEGDWALFFHDSDTWGGILLTRMRREEKFARLIKGKKRERNNRERTRKWRKERGSPLYFVRALIENEKGKEDAFREVYFAHKGGGECGARLILP